MITTKSSSSGKNIMRAGLMLLLGVVMMLSAPSSAKISEEALRKLEKEWDANEDDDYKDPDALPTDERGHVLPPKTKMEMVFTEVKTGSKRETEELTTKWTAILSTGQLLLKSYAIEENRILFVVESGYRDVMRLKEFVLSQPETVNFEWNQQKSTPEDWKKNKKLKKQYKNKQKQKKDSKLNDLLGNLDLDELMARNEL
eukprot:gb/GEZN01018075.1/.p1 GENE.gb/GEZN01018075.1/~~gb/GEZN01018075.1/.p1  ORF type:complete len:200 (+),score=43.55 gb/GEZN01018075.1/:28-627(+)